MKKIMELFWTIWIEIGLFLQEGLNRFLISWAGINPLRIDLPRISFPALQRRDNSKEKMEIRATFGEIRSIDEEQGIVEAYLTRWDSIDSYNSTFLRGAFRKTFKERKNKIRLLFNHSVLAGKVLEAREDKVGPFVQVQFNLETTAGKDAFAHVRAKDIDCFSFGFLPVLDRRNKKTGVREIQEVKCFECGPVIFEANEEATIEAIRSRFGGRDNIELLPFDQTIDERSQTFQDTLDDDEIRNKGWKMVMALDNTLWDIWYGNTDPMDIIGKMDAAISDFHSAYLEWAQMYMDRFWVEEGRSLHLPFINDLQKSVFENIGSNRSELEDFAKRSSLTMDDLDLLIRGKILPFDRRGNMKDLPEPVQQSHHSERRQKIESLCSEIRGNQFSPAERTRFGALLGIVPMPEGNEGNPPKNESRGSEGVDFSDLLKETRTGLMGIFKNPEPSHESTEGSAAPAATKEDSAEE
jgi:HK97 family phage prohead protease